MKTKPELRIEIARDVLKHIKAKRIIIQHQTYFLASSKKHHEGKQLKDVLSEIKECKVCALGGMFYSYVSKYNNYTIPEHGIKDIDYKASSMRNLLSMFTKPQLHLIETAFEEQQWCDASDLIKYSHETINRALGFRNRNGINWRAGDEDALIHIMKNIIRNKGTFKP